MSCSPAALTQWLAGSLLLVWLLTTASLAASPGLRGGGRFSFGSWLTGGDVRVQLAVAAGAASPGSLSAALQAEVRAATEVWALLRRDDTGSSFFGAANDARAHSGGVRCVPHSGSNLTLRDALSRRAWREVPLDAAARGVRAVGERDAELLAGEGASGTPPCGAPVTRPNSWAPVRDAEPLPPRWAGHAPARAPPNGEGGVPRRRSGGSGGVGRGGANRTSPALSLLLDSLPIELRPRNREVRAASGPHSTLHPSSRDGGEEDPLLEPGLDDPDYGLEVRVPPLWLASGAGAGGRDAAREAHAAAAGIAVVVPTVARVSSPLRCNVVPHYWRTGTLCRGRTRFSRGFPDPPLALRPGTVDIPPPPWASPSEGASSPQYALDAAREWLVACARACDADALCVGFDALGRLLAHADAVACGLWEDDALARNCGDGNLDLDDCLLELPPLHAGTWLKAPPSEAPVTRRVVFAGTPPQEWWVTDAAVVLEPAATGVLFATADSAWLAKTDPAVGEAYMRRVCVAAGSACAGFQVPGGELLARVSPAGVFASDAVRSTLWTRAPLPPLNYAVMSVVSLLEQVQAAAELAGGTCGIRAGGLPGPVDGARGRAPWASPSGDPSDAAESDAAPGATIADARDSGRGGPGSDGPSRDSWDALPPLQPSAVTLARNAAAADALAAAAEAAAARLVSADAEHGAAPLPWDEALPLPPVPAPPLQRPSGGEGGDPVAQGPAPGFPPPPPPATHVFVIDVTRPEWAGPSDFWSLDSTPVAAPLPPTPGSPTAAVLARGPASPHYWFRAFAWLRAAYGHSPCVTFAHALEYPRLREVAPPAGGRGNPQWHPDNDGRILRRQRVRQTLDVVSALRLAGAAAPRAAALLWDDDCVACAGTLAAYARGAASVAAFDAHWGALKAGAGGAGVLIAADLVAQLAVYLATRRGSDNVDVSAWRFLHGRGAGDYLSAVTRAAHRGVTSSLQPHRGALWHRATCGAPLDAFWGAYAARGCDVDAIARGLAEHPTRLRAEAVAGVVRDALRLEPPPPPMQRQGGAVAGPASGDLPAAEDGASVAPDGSPAMPPHTPPWACFNAVSRALLRGVSDAAVGGVRDALELAWLACVSPHDEARLFATEWRCSLHSPGAPAEERAVGPKLAGAHLLKDGDAKAPSRPRAGG